MTTTIIRYCIYEFLATLGQAGRGSLFVLTEVNATTSQVTYGLAFSPDAPQMVAFKNWDHLPSYAAVAAYETSDRMLQDVKDAAKRLDAKENIVIDDREIYDGTDRENWMKLIGGLS